MKVQTIMFTRNENGATFVLSNGRGGYKTFKSKGDVDKKVSALKKAGYDAKELFLGGLWLVKIIE